MDLLGVPKKHLKQGTSNPGKVSSSPGGVGRNIAENLVRLGQTCCLMAPIGDDANERVPGHYSGSSTTSSAHFKDGLLK